MDYLTSAFGIAIFTILMNLWLHPPGPPSAAAPSGNIVSAQSADAR